MQGLAFKTAPVAGGCMGVPVAVAHRPMGNHLFPPSHAHCCAATSLWMILRPTSTSPHPRLARSLAWG